jgi:hypothetical protein
MLQPPQQQPLQQRTRSAPAKRTTKLSHRLKRFSGMQRTSTSFVREDDFEAM